MLNMNVEMVFPVLIAFAISALVGPVIIKYLRELKIKQTERTDGVQSHLRKQELPPWEELFFCWLW